MAQRIPRDKVLVTSFLVVNLHCPSCVSHIEEALYALSPKPFSVSPSIVSNWVTVHHSAKLPVDAINSALEEIGFEVSDVTPDRSINFGSSTSPRRTNSSTVSEGYIDRVMEEWRTTSHNKLAKNMDEERRQRHVQNCSMCQDGSGHDVHNGPTPDVAASKSASTTILPKQNGTHSASGDGIQSKKRSSMFKRPSGKKALTPEVIESPPSPIETKVPQVIVDSEADSKEWRLTLAVGGMTCASCSTAITKALQAKSWVKKAAVNLVGNSATIDYFGKGDDAALLIEAIEDIGYDATLDKLIDIQKDGSKKAGEDEWKVTVAVGGMTCASCVNSIKRGLEKRDWIKEAVVNLIGNRATVVFKGKGREDEVIEAIEELGYDATLDSLEDLNAAREESSRRTVELEINGMFCDHCPLKIHDAFTEYEDRIRIEKEISISDPILMISYVPNAPNFTIRQIISAIQDVDPNFEVSIYHPPSLEERSQMIHAAEQRRLLRRVGLTIVVAIPTFIIGIVFMSLLPKDNKVRQYIMKPLSGVSRAQWALFTMSTPIYFFAADVFHLRAIKEVRSMWRRGSKTPMLQRFYRFGSMNMLMSLGTTIAYISSIAQLISGIKNGPAKNDNAFYFDSVVFLTMFLLIGRLIESYSKTRTGDAVTMLGKLRPNEAILLDGGVGISTKVDLLEFNDIIRVLHGGSPPADGIIHDGETSFDESSLTGESKLVRKNVGDEVYAGTINKDGAVSIRITGVGGSSMLDQIVAAVREGQTKRAPIERIADALTGYFVPVVTLISIITWIIWMSLGLSGRLPADYREDESEGWPAWSLQFAIALFVVACPCGLALAAPTALFVGGGLAAHYGILVKGGGEAFEKSSRLDCIVFDKTGTLTVGGEPTVTDHMFTSKFDEDELLSMVKTVEESSSHTVAKAIVTFCKEKNVKGFEAIDTKETPGHGIKGTFSTDGGKTITSVIIGNESMMQTAGLSVMAEDKKMLDTWKKQGKSVAVVATSISEAEKPRSGSSSRASSSGSSKPTGSYTLALMLAVSDPIRPETHFIIEALQKRGIEVWMLSGDNEITAKAIGVMAGICEHKVIAGVLPSEKADVIKNLQRSLNPHRNGSIDYSRRAIIAMVGDGINDSPALTTADIGIAIGSGSDIAISSAEFVLVNSNLNTLLILLDLSRFVFNRIKFNFAWAFIYNLIALPVAAGALYPLKSGGSHVRLDPVWASLAMAMSSISVVLSSLSLRSGVPGIGFRPRDFGGEDKVLVEGGGALKL